MRDSRPSLYAYIITSLCVVIFTAFGWEQMVIVAIPVIIPAIFFYYIQTATQPISIGFSVALWLFFAADMIEIVDEHNGIYLIIICTALSYLIMFGMALRDKVKLSFIFKPLFITAIFAMLSSTVLIEIIKKAATSDANYIFIFNVYAVVIVSIFSYAILRIFSKNDLTSKMFLVMVISMFISDLLYGYYRYVGVNKIVVLAGLTSQFISYYFMVEYFNRRKVSEIDTANYR